jgi:uncharacterized protein YqgV (UPF0045/DUF77 family)
MFETWDAQKRLTEAKRVTKSVVDHTLYLLWIHEQNELVLFSDTLSKQIPRSRAANAFNIFRVAMHQIEVVRLCALWDAATIDRESIPTAVELIDAEPVIELILEQTRAEHANVVTEKMEGVDEADVPHVMKAVQELHQKFGNERAERAAVELKETIKNASDFRKSEIVKSMRRLRDQKVAHNLVEGAARDVEIISPMKYGDERKVLEQSVSIVETLYRWINATGISFAASREIDRKCAEGLWKACTFKVTY